MTILSATASFLFYGWGYPHNAGIMDLILFLFSVLTLLSQFNPLPPHMSQGRYSDVAGGGQPNPQLPSPGPASVKTHVLLPQSFRASARSLLPATQVDLRPQHVPSREDFLPNRAQSTVASFP